MASKFVIVFIRLILEKVRIDGFSEPRLKIDIRFQYDLKIVLKDLGYK